MEPCDNASFIKDDTNSKYKYWFKLDLRNHNVYLPLQFNKDYNNFELVDETEKYYKTVVYQDLTKTTNNTLSYTSEISLEEYLQESQNIINPDYTVCIMNGNFEMKNGEINLLFYSKNDYFLE